MPRPWLPGRWPLLLLWGWWWALAAVPTQAEVAVPPLRSHLTDLTQTLTAQQQQAIEHDLAELQARKGAQIAVLIVPSTQSESIEQYARRILDAWQLGRKGVDDGALLLVAKDDRRLRIETQYGLEGVIPDATAKRIMVEDITPALKRGDFYGGIAAGLGRMIGLVDGEPLPPPPPPKQDPDWSSIEDLLAVLVFAVVFVAGALRALLGELFGAAAAGAVVGLGLWLSVGSLILAGAGAMAAFLIVLLGRRNRRGRGGSRRDKGRQRPSDWGWWSGGGGFSGGGNSGGGGSSGGGFSGGGGSGGGGGASDSW
ncbi:TPM domain-containing protein [Candidatus Thiodictyon syntrophicum]|uniref:TPM domain-containing protein n=1 Tax=Candidatus Thiodictyon syntrophicum TaxID=1166950 RepID=A0A2K8UHM3_9GAMM|nr:TPM domain-containing protein [Candidatus Thiodictyon syntrophicum]AUB85083.1 hypothetical protein THSYN_29570 [Candidatus Thiodictyon syntrophicum]